MTQKEVFPMRGIGKRIAALTAAVVIGLGVSATEAQANSAYWPANGEVVTRVNGNHHSITLAFSLDQSQLDSLRQQGAYLELDFIAYDAGISGDSSDYEFYTNIPGALKDIPFLDRTFTPGATAIETARLQANTHYYTTIKWYSNGPTIPQISVDFVPSRWAGSDVSRNWSEQIISCANGFINAEYAWCIFPVEGARYKLLSPLHGGLVPADGSTYSLHPSVIDGAPRNFA